MSYAGKKILVVEDDLVWSKQHRRLLEKDFKGCLVEEINSLWPEDVLARLDAFGPDIILLDIRGTREGDRAGFEVCKRIREYKGIAIPILFITAYSDVEYIIEGLKLGANDFIDKGQRQDLRSLRIRIWLDFIDLIDKNKRLLDNEINLVNKIDSRFVYAAALMSDLLRRLERVVTRSDDLIMIRGETGVGKEVFVRELARMAQKKLICRNCAATSDSLMESELFGHEKGAFTGAYATKKGLFEQAKGGILFLDEIGDISPKMQVELLRVLQEKKVYRIGNVKEGIDITDVRIVCATNQDLEQMVETGQFRRDLFFRLTVHPLVIPPLRERPEDITVLTEYFLNLYNKKYYTKIGIEVEVMAAFQRYAWPGNVRELEHVMRNLCVEVDDRISLSLMQTHYPHILRPISGVGQVASVAAGFCEEEELAALEIWRRFHFRRSEVAKFVKTHLEYQGNPFLDPHATNCSNKLKTIFIKALVDHNFIRESALAAILGEKQHDPILHDYLLKDMNKFLIDIRKTLLGSGKSEAIQRLVPFCRRQYGGYAKKFIERLERENV
jgi:DNA-binding NtrC family response regulator